MSISKHTIHITDGGDGGDVFTKASYLDQKYDIDKKLVLKPESAAIHISNGGDGGDVFTKASYLDQKYDIDKKLVLRPGSAALKNIGINLIRMQYSENCSKPLISKVSEENNSKSKGELWQSVWPDDQPDMYFNQFRHILENRLNKTYRCTFSRSRLCNNQAKMTRLSWIFHARRGHVRINRYWKHHWKKNKNIKPEKMFEILCIVCNKFTRPAYLSTDQMVRHMTIKHPQFLPYNEFLSYFERCFICNEQTKPYNENLIHRQQCLTELLKDPNQFGTENFNACFKTQRLMSTLSLESTLNETRNFDSKLKQFVNYKGTSLFYWAEIKKSISQQLIKPTTNGFKENSVTLNSNWNALRFSVLAKKSPNNYTFSISERIAPGSTIDTEKIHKFFIPVPFTIKNETHTKQMYVKWRKSVKNEHSLIQSSAPWICEICNTMLKNGRSVYCHIKMCHASAEFQEATCKTCDKKFMTNLGYRNHFQGIKNCPVARRCMVCNIPVSISDIYEHMSLKHKEALGILFQLKTCLICRSQTDNLQSHLCDMHGMPDTIQGQPNIGKVTYRNGSFFNCTKCSMTYFSEIELRNHMIMNEHYFECAKCPTLRFYLSWELIRHMVNSHTVNGGDNDDRQCDLCPPVGGDNGSLSKPVTFASSNEKIRHFIKAHICPCTVRLEDVVKDKWK